MSTRPAPVPAEHRPTVAQTPSFLAVSRRRKVIGLLVSAVVLGAICVVSLAVGTQYVSLPVVWQAVTDYRDIGDQWIVHDLRIPRTALALAVGLALGLSGTLIQAVARNPLADTEVLGINSGAALFVVMAIAFLGLQSPWTYIWFAFIGALVAMLAVYLVGWAVRGTTTPVQVLLAGVAVGAVLDGISFTVRLLKPRAFDNMRFWDAGALDGRSLNTNALGDDVAKAMGTNVARTQTLSLVAVTLLAGAATAGAGPIGFVGLMVPHIVRRYTGPDWRWILAYATFVAPTLLLAADVVGRVVVPPAELPAGIVTAFIGAPVLIYVVRRSGGWQR